MFLKALEIRGFKSFADKTRLDFAPGVAVIVGPNGSGKSNLVDAIAWVLGEQGPKTLRGGKMEDVIFAGTPNRPASGRAEVSLTIDNSQHLLPIEFSEVTIRRTLFRTGESEYAINSAPCRLLDIQELLSDSGIGRELHTIVGQGQLDAILDARPEERRLAIEEAAGILKHRKRRERSVRKLERVDHDVERLQDVISELRRQIRPLERQAEIAQRAAEVERELTEVKLKVWVLDYRRLTSGDDVDEERRAAGEVEARAAAVAAAESDVERLEREALDAAGAAEEALQAEYRLKSLLERAEGLRRLAEERARHLRDLAAREPQGRVPPTEEVEEARRALEEASVARAQAEAEAQRAEAEWRAMAAAREEAARAREQVLHLSGERAALRAAVEAGEEERRRLRQQRAALAAAHAERARDIEAVRREIERLDADESPLIARIEEIEERRAEQEAEAKAHEASSRRLEREVAALEAKREILAEEVARASAPAQALEGLGGIGGRLRDLFEIEAGFERAVRAALEPYADAILASSRGDAVTAVERLKGAGKRGAFLVAGEVRESDLPAGLTGVLQVATPRGPGADVLRGLLGGVALARSLAEATTISREHGVAAVTPDGDRVGSDLVVGGSPAEARDANVELREVARLHEERRASLEATERAAAHARAAIEVLEREKRDLGARLDEIDARLTGATERLGQFEGEDHAAEREDAVFGGRLDEVSRRLASAADRLAAAEAQLSRAVAQQPEADAATVAEIERRTAERTLHLGEVAERERIHAARLAELEGRARGVAEERAAWEAGRDVWTAGAARAGAIAAGAGAMAARLADWTQEGLAARERWEAARARLGDEVQAARRARREAEAALTAARDRAHEADLRRAERSHRVSSLIDRLREEHRMSPDEAVAAVAVEGADADELRQRAVALERRLGMLGRANPIAMEQYQGLVDRHAFLTQQVDDLRKSRRDLVGVIEEIDRKIAEIFTAAFADVAREFTETFGRLFPGGEGRLVLTDPDDPLGTGIEVEARPAGKRVKRISLLSGGERSLTAIALLFSIFRARPSPFYLLDEVEAALDDINLHRFLEVSREFRDRSQLLIVTHQKRTMEIADALYGISMGGDGVTRVIAERLDDRDGVEAERAGW